MSDSLNSSIPSDRVRLINAYCSASAARQRYLQATTTRRGVARLARRRPSDRRRTQLDRAVDVAASRITDRNADSDQISPLDIVDGVCLETVLARLSETVGDRQSDASGQLVAELRQTISEARIASARGTMVDLAACVAQLDELSHMLRGSDRSPLAALDRWVPSRGLPAA